MIDIGVGAVVALCSAGISWALTHHWEKKKYRSSEQTNLEPWLAEVRAWSGEVIELMNRIHWQFDSAPEAEAIEASADMALALSCLVEKGRLLLPNENRDQYGQSKQESRQGYRSPVLDPIVAAVTVARGKQPLFDFHDPKGKFGNNRHSKALRLYINAFISMVERLLMVRAGKHVLVERMEVVGGVNVAREVETLLFPSAQNPPPGHRYWLGEESGPSIPNESKVFGRGT